MSSYAEVNTENYTFRIERSSKEWCVKAKAHKDKKFGAYWYTVFETKKEALEYIQKNIEPIIPEAKEEATEMKCLKCKHLGEKKFYMRLERGLSCQRARVCTYIGGALVAIEKGVAPTVDECKWFEPKGEPCIFCERHKAGVTCAHGSHPCSRLYQMKCSSCGAQGPKEYTRTEARAAWKEKEKGGN